MDLQRISEETIKRYSDRYKTLGKSIRTLGWGSEEQQLYRFSQSLSEVDMNGKSLLDIGCGFADYYRFLKGAGTEPASYTGWDNNADFVKEARLEHINSSFDVVDLSKEAELVAHKENFDVAVMFGLLNYNWKSEELNSSYSKMMVANAFTLVKEILVVDFLSSRLYEGYPKEDFIYYHDPAAMLDFALSLSPNVVLKHNYAPIPQKEFMLFIYK